MYNLNVNLVQTAANAVNNLLADSTCTTPRTPEILNSLIAMTNPLDNYQFETSNNKTTIRPPTNMSSDSNSSSSSQIESSSTTTATTVAVTNPPSVQHTCSQLIKAGLKLSIEQKRKHQSDGEDLLDLDKCSKRIKKNDCSESEEDRQRQDGMQNWTWYETDDNLKLTPEDEERRRRRRERNKIAATKCRLKKREKTANLVNESETLEAQNVDLKTQLQELQNQKRTLVDMLTSHRPLCQHNISPATRDSLYRLPPMATVIDNHFDITNSRPASVDSNFRLQNLEIYNNNSTRSASVGITYTKITTSNYKMSSNDLIDENDDYQPQLTNLDNISSYNYNNQCHNYNNNQNYNSTTGMDNGCMA